MNRLKRENIVVFRAFCRSWNDILSFPLCTHWYIVEREQPLVDIAISSRYPLVHCCRESNRWLQLCPDTFSLFKSRSPEGSRSQCRRIDRADNRRGLYDDVDEAVVATVAGDVEVDPAADEAVAKRGAGRGDGGRRGDGPNDWRRRRQGFKRTAVPGRKFFFFTNRFVVGLV